MIEQESKGEKLPKLESEVDYERVLEVVRQLKKADSAFDTLEKFANES